ncbi:MAG: STAS domain-containing protein [Ignavibacteria bacterium]|nr:STAS domain-containing protein [Ignavibacteria bacterium]
MPVTSSHGGDGVSVVKVTGSLIGGKETDELRRVLGEMVLTRRTKLLIDLSGVTYANSTAIGVLMSTHTSYTRRRWSVAFCGVTKELNVVLVVTKLNLVFELHKSCEEALKSLSSR